MVLQNYHYAKQLGMKTIAKESAALEILRHKAEVWDLVLDDNEHPCPQIVSFKRPSTVFNAFTDYAVWSIHGLSEDKGQLVEYLIMLDILSGNATFQRENNLAKPPKKITESCHIKNVQLQRKEKNGEICFIIK